MTKYIGKIPALFIIADDNIEWLVIEPHVNNNEIIGYYMYLHKNISEPALWDNWYPSLEIAFEAGEAYGLKKMIGKLYFQTETTPR